MVESSYLAVIKVVGGSLSENADDAERALIDAGVAFFER